MGKKLFSAFNAFIKKHQLVAPGKTVLLAISGGVDSVVLGQLFYEAQIPFVLAHCNFQLRGAESIRDEKFTASLAEKWNVPLYLKKFETEAVAASEKISTQVAARNLRYNWFHTLKLELAAKGIDTVLATAHHANDAAETMLINLFRGTGIEGLHGILSKRDGIIRPLLFATKKELVEYAQSLQLQWVEDSSNESAKYTRNLLRHEIIPTAEKVYPAAVSNMMETMEKLHEVEQLYHQALEGYRKKLLVKQGAEWAIPVLKLLQSKPLRTITYELIKPFGFSEGQIDEVLKLGKSNSGAFVAAHHWRIIRHRKWLVVSPMQNELAQHVLLNENAGTWFFTKGALHLSPVHLLDMEKLKKLPAHEAWLDARHIQFPLVLRPWKAGDYFYPLGMPKKKKVARFLIDAKLSKSAKENIWVLESNKKVIWIVGHRVDDRFKVLPATTTILKVVFEARN